MSFKAYVMAAGLGTRLYPLTGRTSKPMVPILNRPVMEHLLRLLRRHDVKEVAANLHYHPDKIRNYFGDGSAFGVELRYNLEKQLLGTAGGEQRREHVPGPIHERIRGHVVEDGRLEGVDTAVAEVGQRLGSRWLLLKSDDAAVVVGDDHAVQRRVVNLLDGQGGDAAILSMRGDEGGEIDIREPVAADDDEGAAG